MQNEVNIDFVQWNPDGSRVELSFTEDDDNMNLYLLHDFCKHFAAAVGYKNSNIEEVFGETQL